MAYNAKEYMLGEVIEVLDSKRIPLSSRERLKRCGKYPYYGAQGIIDYIDAYIFDGDYILVAEDGENLVTRKRPVANIAKGKFWVNNHAHIIRNNQLADFNYLYFLLNFIDISGYVTGSAQPKLSQGSLNKIVVKLPDVGWQRRVAGILLSLDRKIELNNKMNCTLINMAEAVFKQWFIDFDFPDENSEPYKSSGGKMNWCEGLGMEIPASWSNGSLGEMLINFDSKRVPLSKNQRKKRTGIYPYYGAASVMDHIDGYLFDGIYVLLGEDGTVADERGYPVLQYVWGKFWANNHAHVLQGAKDFSAEYVYMLLKHTNVQGIVTGAVQPKISQGSLNSVQAAIPPKSILNRFNKVTGPIFEKYRRNKEENLILADLKALILPKLMSGELDVSGAEI